MRISVAAACAFVSIFAKDVTQQAIAAPISPEVDRSPSAVNAVEAVPAKAIPAAVVPEPAIVELRSPHRQASDRAVTPPQTATPSPEFQLPQTKPRKPFQAKLPELLPELLEPPELPESTLLSAAENAAIAAFSVPAPVPVAEAEAADRVAPPAPLVAAEDETIARAAADGIVAGEIATDGIPIADTATAEIAPIAPVALDSAEQETIASLSVTVEDARPASVVPPEENAAAPESSTTPENSTEEAIVAPSIDFAPNPDPLQIPTQPSAVELREVAPITLQQALELARRNNQQLQTAQLQLERAQAAQRETQAANLPTVNANANAAVQQTAADVGDTVNPVLGGGLEVNYDLYTSGRRSAQIEIADQQTRFQELQLAAVSGTIQLDVTNAYYSLQEADQRVRIAQAALEESERSLSDATALELAGVGTLFDRLQTEVDVINTRQDLTLARGEQQSARRQLRQQLNIAEPVGVTAADPVAMAGVWNPSLEETIVLAYQNRAELAQQLVQRQISQQQRQIALSELGPQVSLFANFGVQHSFNRSGFSEDSQIGARVQLGLFDGGAARARADQEDANIALAETQFSDVRGQIRLEVEQAYLTLQSNFENTRTATQAVDVATEALRLARLRFQAGVGTQSDVSRLQGELVRAEGNRLQTILNYNRALASLLRSIGPPATELSTNSASSTGNRG